MPKTRNLKPLLYENECLDFPAFKFTFRTTNRMFLRKRKSNLSIERAIYRPAQKDADGNIVVHPVRTTEYLGSMNAYATYTDAPIDLLAKLDDSEKAELKEFLKVNEPKVDRWLVGLPKSLEWAARDLTLCAGFASSKEDRNALDGYVKAAEQAWNAFYKNAQTLGLKRTVNRRKKTPATSEAKGAEPQA